MARACRPLSAAHSTMPVGRCEGRRIDLDRVHRLGHVRLWERERCVSSHPTERLLCKEDERKARRWYFDGTCVRILITLDSLDVKISLQTSIGLEMIPKCLGRQRVSSHPE